MVDTNRIDSNSIVDLIIYLKWKSNDVVHTDGFQASNVNLWRDILPPALYDAMMNKEVGERIQVPLKNGDAVAEFRKEDLFDIRSNQFDRRFVQDRDTEPRLGRFYPKRLLTGITGIFNRSPGCIQGS